MKVDFDPCFPTTYRSTLMSDEVESARNAVFQKIGRNIALFQQLEGGLKDFFTVRVVEGSSKDEVARLTAARRKEVAIKSLGQVVGQFFEDLAKEESESANELAGTWRFRTSFRIEGEEYLQQKSELLKNLVGERNRLVHHLHDDFDLRNADSVARLDALLDPQADRIRAELSELQETFKCFEESRQLMLEFLNSPEYLDSLMNKS
jgi:hypothetical protein